MNGFLLALVLVAWGGQAVAPWRLRRAGETTTSSATSAGAASARRLWGYAALPLLLAGALAVLLYVHERPDAAIAAGLSPLLATLPGKILVLLLAALLLADLVLAIGKGGIENLGWPLTAVLGLLFLATAALDGELLRVGEGDPGPLPLLFVAAFFRLLVALGAGEAIAVGRPLFALAAGLALPLYFLCLPPALRQAIAGGGYWLTLVAAAVLFLAARWLPASLRRPSVIAAALLAGIFFAQAGDLSQHLPASLLPPMPAMPATPTTSAPPG